MKKPFAQASCGRCVPFSNEHRGGGKLRLGWLLALMTMLFSLPVFSQTPAGLTLRQSQVSLEQFIAAVQSQSDYSFFYKDNEINANTRISVDVKDASINDLLAAAFRGTEIAYRVQGRQIVLTKRPAAVAKQPKNLSIKGMVTTTSGEPLVGVTVTVAGTTTGTLTDIDGWYTITVPNRESVL